MGGLHKKSEAGLVIVLVLVIAALFFGWLVNINQRECTHNKDCGSEAYCGSDFSCHSYPTIQKTVVQYNFFWPAVILGFAILAATIIFRWEKIVKEKVTVEPKTGKSAGEESNASERRTRSQLTEEIEEPYYKSNDAYYKSPTNSKTP